MNCANCKPKSCRSSISCGAENFDTDELINEYNKTENQQVIQAASALVDNGKAGQLSRLEEIIEFIRLMNYEKVGLAYCYGMEKEARMLKDLFKLSGISLTTVSCTVGGINQNNINTSSCTQKVSCNPIGQAIQINESNIDFVLIMGICLGHDILLQRNLNCDFTTFVVKDRVYTHSPINALYNESKAESL